MGTGKTETAKILAQRLKLTYFSMDEEIEKRQGMPIAEIFKAKGEPYFRQLEQELAQELTARSDLVIDAGGGVVLNKENIKNLKQNSIVFCLTATPQKILARTKHYRHRPLLEVRNPLAQIKELLESRALAYKLAADFEIDGTNLTVVQTADKIQELLEDVK
jgi:shikimate kinase